MSSDHNMTRYDANDASTFACSGSSKAVGLVDVDMDVDEKPVDSNGTYEVLTVPGQPHPIEGLKFKDDDREEEEAEMSSDSDDDEDEEENSTEIPVSVLLGKTIDEYDSEDDEDYIPN